MPLIYQKFITRQNLKDNPETLYVFGDNLERVGLGGQAKEMRGEPNAIGLPTKLLPSHNNNAYLTEEHLILIIITNTDDVDKLIHHLDHEKIVIWPTDGIGTGLAKLEEKAPNIFNYYEHLRIFLAKIGEDSIETRTFN